MLPGMPCNTNASTVNMEVPLFPGIIYCLYITKIKN